MKLKYYLRGLAVGIICTAIIMGIALSGGKKEKLTDAEIIERARILGMVMEEDADSKEGQKEADGQEEQDKRQEAKDSKEKETEKENQNNKTDQKKDAKDKAEDSKAEQKKTENGKSAAEGTDKQGQPEMKTVEIITGDYSDVVSQKLFEAGLIEDAAAFNNYLTKSGADQNLMIGVHQIPMGATQEEIIQILGQKSE